MKFYHLVFLFSILIVSSCTQSVPNSKQSDISDELPYSQQVFYQIFPAVFDSLGVASYIVPVPPPPIPGSQYFNDSLEYKKAINEYNEMIKRAEQNTAIPIIALNDTAYYSEEVPATYYGLSEKKKSTLQKSFKIDIEKLLVQADTFQLVYLSKVAQKNSYKLKKNYRKRVKTRLTLSTVYFDSSKTSGFLEWSLSCGPLCGQGGRIFIQNINGKWVIVDIVITSVS